MTYGKIMSLMPRIQDKTAYSQMMRSWLGWLSRSIPRHHGSDSEDNRSDKDKNSCRGGRGVLQLQPLQGVPQVQAQGPHLTAAMTAVGAAAAALTLTAPASSGCCDALVQGPGYVGLVLCCLGPLPAYLPLVIDFSKLKLWDKRMGGTRMGGT